MKKKWTAALLAAALMTALMGGAAFAAVHFGVLNLFTDGERWNEMIPEATQTLSESYEGQSVRLTMQDAVYDVQGKSFALSWTIENLQNEENLYVLCDSLTFGGERAHLRNESSVTEFLLDMDTTYSLALGELPENGGNECQISFLILRPLTEIEEVSETNPAEAILERGNIPMEADGCIEISAEANQKYPYHLVDSGLFEVADRFELTFELDESKLANVTRTYQGKTDFVFEDYEIRIRHAEITATAACIQIEYITPEIPKDAGKGFGPLWEVQFEMADGQFWYTNGGGVFQDPVQMEDGRYMSVYECEFLNLITQPDQLYMTLITYDENLNPTEHREETIELNFE